MKTFELITFIGVGAPIICIAVMVGTIVFTASIFFKAVNRKSYENRIIE